MQFTNVFFKGGIISPLSPAIGLVLRAVKHSNLRSNVKKHFIICIIKCTLASDYQAFQRGTGTDRSFEAADETNAN